MDETKHPLFSYLRNSTPAKSVREFAEAVGVDRVTVHRWIDGSRKPSLDVAVKIEALTNGAVKPSDFVEAA